MLRFLALGLVAACRLGFEQTLAVDQRVVRAAQRVAALPARVRYGCGLAAPPHCLALVPSNGITTDLLGDATSPPPRQTLAALD